MTLKAAINLQHVYKRYVHTDNDALQNINLQIEKGECFGLVGVNGSGKTTLISIIAGLFLASRGEVFIEGIKQTDTNAAIKQLIGFVPQEIALYPNLTLYENLNFFAKLYNVPKAEITDNIQHCLQLTELTAVANKRIATFSGGMQRRANLAIGLVHKPTILLLDEPTANVDVHARATIISSLQKMSKDGITILYTTHYLEEIENLCARIAILQQGKIICLSTIKALLAENSDCHTLTDIFLKSTSTNSDV